MAKVGEGTLTNCLLTGLISRTAAPHTQNQIPQAIFRSHRNTFNSELKMVMHADTKRRLTGMALVAGGTFLVSPDALCVVVVSRSDTSILHFTQRAILI